MKRFVSFAALAAAALAQFEATDFNVTEALLDNGIDCNSLKVLFGDDQVETRSETAYSSWLNSLWSGQQRLIAPECVFKPEKPLDISTAILIARLTECPFAAKSGGHSSVPGGSNIAGGISISFVEKMNAISVSSDKKTVSFQPGNTWLNIYTRAAKDGLAVNGGRVASVGVGGLLLGGGISYTGGINGMSCDNIISYELVTASGLVINVDQNKYADLYWALRGGGNNFGIVTKFTVEAFPLGPTMWGGMRTYTQGAFSALIDAYYNLGMNAPQDGKAHQILSFSFRAPNVQLANVELEYAEPNANASILAEYNAIGGALRDQTAVRSLAELTTLLDGPASGTGLRQGFWTWTMKLDKEMATVAKDIFFEEVTSISDAADLVPAFSLQVLSTPILEKTAKRGGNALGLTAADGPLINALVALKWSNPADDTRMWRFAQKVKDRSFAAATAKGKAHPYVYMNYASPWQDPVASYGSTNKARLISISKKYDPTSVFERLQPGYFKLTRAAYSGSP
ncbi:FAD binding domain-containing protein [Sporormia fimetaria CBS 119925]|uniref:FAD binding domain-containing protein n=1 Tax=Sporormia fimetaria CBS 119925 TaxID=1340428 RepID=A0A6A6V838_9PLEO|nr:FAD binding domain-containing protein [Sporormia fimetaria CBS 119925]